MVLCPSLESSCWLMQLYVDDLYLDVNDFVNLVHWLAEWHGVPSYHALKKLDADSMVEFAE